MTRTTTNFKSMWGAVSLVLLGALPGNAQTAQEVARTALGSTVLVTVEDESGEPLRYGSGFLVHDGEIVTNYHVVEGATGGYANLVGQKTKYDLQRVVAVDRERDLVLLKIAPSGAPALRIADSDIVQVGDPVYVVGNPLGWEGTFSQGVVSGVRQFDDQELFQITAPISPGSSGGPVLNVKGDVIGIAVSTVHDGQNLNFAIPAKYLTKLIESSSSSKSPIVSPDETSALLSLGSKYFHGEGATQNYEEAARLFRVAAAQGNLVAQALLGTMRYYGRGISRDYAEAARWLRLPAEHGHAEAQWLLATLYFSGLGLPENSANGEQWLLLAASQGHDQAQRTIGLRYGLRYEDDTDYAESATWYRMAAEQHSPLAQLQLGYLYYYGRGVSQDYEEAARWFRLAAENGCAAAQSTIGFMYYEGQGVPRTYRTAAKWYRLAAERDNAYAQQTLGSMYYFGWGVHQDYNQAAGWYRLAAESPWPSLSGVPDVSFSQSMLGRMYRHGEGMAKDYVAAHAWLDLAAAQGDRDAAADRDELAKQMTARQIADAQSLAQDFSNSVAGTIRPPFGPDRRHLRGIPAPPQPSTPQRFRDCDGCPLMVALPPGSFLMGEPPPTNAGWQLWMASAARPQHQVTIAQPFAVGVYEVTRAEYGRFLAATGRSSTRSCDTVAGGETRLRRDSDYSQSERHPVVCVNWHEAQEYANWLSRETGYRYRLLTESEWEYAARAGTKTDYYYGKLLSLRQANVSTMVYSSYDRSLAVGSFFPNTFGLYDMHGNVWEWVQDCWNSSYLGAPDDGNAWHGTDCSRRVQRGGSWLNYSVSSAHRGAPAPESRAIDTGFRVARALD